jgi:glucose-1-phosphate adenylyltransferase
VGCIEVPLAEASAFGVMAIDDQRRIVSFAEKPAHPAPMPGHPDMALASMGIYVFDAQALFDRTGEPMPPPQAPPATLAKTSFPALVAQGQAVAHPFGLSCVKSSPDAPSYWRDVGTVDAYWQANIDLTGTVPELDMYNRDWPVWTYQEQLPPAKFVFNDDGRRGSAVDSLVSGGCIISGAAINRSVLFSKVRVHSYCDVQEAVVLPEVTIGRHCVLRKVVIDHGLPDSRWHAHWRGPTSRCPTLSPHTRWRGAGHCRHAGTAVNATPYTPPPPHHG